jgi:hypothetical protein
MTEHQLYIYIVIGIAFFVCGLGYGIYQYAIDSYTDNHSLIMHTLLTLFISPAWPVVSVVAAPILLVLGLGKAARWVVKRLELNKTLQENNRRLQSRIDYLEGSRISLLNSCDSYKSQIGRLKREIKELKERYDNEMV